MITLGDNPCLPPLLGDFFHWRNDEFGVWINNKYISLPHFSYGNMSLRIENVPARRWEVRSLYQLSPYFLNNKVLSWLTLEASEKEQLSTFSSNLRRKINKSQSNGFKVACRDSKYITDFYSIYQKSMHRLGSPALRLEFYQFLVSHYSDGICKIFVAHHGGAIAGAAILLSHKSFFENCWMVTNPSFNKLNVSYLLHWTMIAYAFEQNAEIYSFGRSSINSGVHQYKKQWKTDDYIIYRNFSHPPRKDIRSFTFLSKIWQHTPNLITNSIGPNIAKYLY